MTKTKEVFRRFLRKLYTGLGLTSIALVFQACYGTPQTAGLDALIQGIVKSKTTNKPIGGIKVSVKDVYQFEVTNGYGQFQIYVPQAVNCAVLLEDIDGAANGLYLSKEIPVDALSEKVDLKEIFLDDAE
jgi:hypothetical protein